MDEAKKRHSIGKAPTVGIAELTGVGRQSRVDAGAGRVNEYRDPEVCGLFEGRQGLGYAKKDVPFPGGVLGEGPKGLWFESPNWWAVIADVG